MKRVFLLVTAILFVFTLSACNEQKTLECKNSTRNVILSVVYDRDSVLSWKEDDSAVDGITLVALTDEELEELNTVGLWSVYEGSGHYDLMEKVRESYDNNDVYDSDWAEDSEVPEEDRLAAESVVTCTIN